MRLVTCTLLFGALLGGQAHASSFVAVADKPAATPSLVSRGAASVPAPPSVVQLPDSRSDTLRSVIAMGPPAPPVSDERVAAIDPEEAPAKQPSPDLPIVIRGGIFGDAAPAPVALAEPEAEPQEKLSRPQQRKLERDRRRAIREGKAPPDASQGEAAETTAAPEAPATPDPAPPQQSAAPQSGVE